MIVQEGMLSECWHPPVWSFSSKDRTTNLGVGVRLITRKKFGANQRNGKNSAAVAKTLDPSQAVDEITSSKLFVKTHSRAACQSFSRSPPKRRPQTPTKTRRRCDDAKLHCWIENEIPVRREQANLESVIF